MLKYNKKKTVELHDWDKLVRATYGKPYSFQQQDGCQERGNFKITIPLENPEKYEDTDENEMNDFIPEVVNGREMGVKFDVWLKRDPKDIKPFKHEYENELFWERNFYPDLQTIANDLHRRGLIEAGDYTIKIDW